ncbi:olfactory receptor 14J1-like [Caloenas nicobarica]|uniref:olfactory receptor 14J1-like n=1 Tax=Caloenas nicobarica TaxID=187106 RepID=UPI0032B7587F
MVEVFFIVGNRIGMKSRHKVQLGRSRLDMQSKESSTTQGSATELKEGLEKDKGVCIRPVTSTSTPPCTSSCSTSPSYDLYVAICKPLHYGTLLGSRACVHMAAAAWATGFLYALLHTANTFSLPLCKGNAVDQFFCEIPQILKLSCSNSYLREAWLLVIGVFSAFICFIFILFSYVQILRAVLRIPSEQGRYKAFSTCLPHLAMLSLFVSTGSFAYLKPPSISSSSLDLVVSVLYSVVPPAANPLIYSMRNQELQDSVWKLITALLQ